MYGWEDDDQNTNTWVQGNLMLMEPLFHSLSLGGMGSNALGNGFYLSREIQRVS